MSSINNGNEPPVNNHAINSNNNGDIYATLYSIHEAADKLRRHPNTIRNMWKTGELDKTHIGRTPYAFKDEVDNIADRNRRRGGNK
jgi:hypothetical protein